MERCPSVRTKGVQSSRNQNGAIAATIAVNAAPSQQQQQQEGPQGKANVSIAYEDEDMQYTAIPASKSKTLKINMDLMIVSCMPMRQATCACHHATFRRMLQACTTLFASPLLCTPCLPNSSGAAGRPA